MKRYRWLKAKWPTTVRVLAKRLKASSFDEERASGFVIDRVRDDFLEARYVERLEYEESVLDPFGKELTFHRIDYRQCEFRASTDIPGLELLDAPRGFQTMISRLAEATEFSLAISPIVVNVLAWAKALQKQLDRPGIVDSVQIGSMELAPQITAKMVIKGAVDVLAVGNKQTEGRKHTIEKVQLRFGGPERTTVLLAASGVVRVEHEPSEEILGAIRDSLGKLLAGRA